MTFFMIFGMGYGPLSMSHSLLGWTSLPTAALKEIIQDSERLGKEDRKKSALEEPRDPKHCIS